MPQFITLRTISIVLKNGGRHLNINALSDVASEKTYILSDATQELGLCGKSEKIMVNVSMDKSKLLTQTQLISFIMKMSK